ncbi:MAG: hypothetical protein ACI825_000797 [Planctomycetota bacterium]|jgi:hypothetical protein|uniref:hypothetical protein n=1 Tax=Patiriisocius sp. Uisw_047 TaxID=3230969 RepID=UPI0039ECB547
MTVSEKVEAVLQESELNETIKWSAHALVLAKKIVIGFLSFNNHFEIWFHKGCF